MRSAILLPAAILSVLGAFSQPCYRECFELTGNGAVQHLVDDVASQMTATASVRIAAIECATAPTMAQVANSAPGADVLAFAFAPSEHETVHSQAVATSGLVFVVHPHRTLDGLSSEQIIAIATGKITNWHQLGGPDAPIALLFGDAFVAGRIASHFAIDPKSLADARDCGGDLHCSRMISRDPFAIGCMSVTAALRAAEAGAPINLLQLDGHRATRETVQDGSYPLRRTLFAQCPESMSGIGRQLLDYLHSASGAEVLRAHGYEPIVRG